MSPTFVDVHTVGCGYLEHSRSTVTVTGVDDLVADGSVVYTIVTAAASLNGHRTTAGLDAADPSSVTNNRR